MTSKKPDYLRNRVHINKDGEVGSDIWIDNIDWSKCKGEHNVKIKK